MTEKSLIAAYRPCVGVMLLNAEGLAWIGRRFDKQNDEGKGHWWQIGRASCRERVCMLV